MKRLNLLNKLNFRDMTEDSYHSFFIKVVGGVMVMIVAVKRFLSFQNYNCLHPLLRHQAFGLCFDVQNLRIINQRIRWL